MKVAAFDIATVTGVCVGEACATPKAWSHDLGKGAHEMRFARITQLVWSVCKEHRPNLVAIEAPVGGPKTSHLLVGLWACATGAALLAGCKVEKHNIGAVRSHFLGRNPTTRDFPGMSKVAAKRAMKAQVMHRCNMLGWQVEDSDSADAAAVWDYACSLQSKAHQMKTIGGLF